MHSGATAGRRPEADAPLLAAVLALAFVLPASAQRRRAALRLPGRFAQRALHRARRAQRELVRLGRRPEAGHGPCRRVRRLPLDARARLARPRPARLRALRLGDGDGRVRAPGRLLRARSGAPRGAAAAARRQRLVLRGLRPRAQRPRLRAVRLDGRVGVLALEGQLLSPRLGHGRVGGDAGGEFRSLLSTLVGIPSATCRP